MWLSKLNLQENKKYSGLIIDKKKGASIEISIGIMIILSLSITLKDMYQ